MTSHSQGHSEEDAQSADQGSHIDSSEDPTSDTDSAFSRSEGSFLTTSITSSVLDYNGRRYHQFHDGKYIFPNDEKEQDRLDMLHHIYLLLQGGSIVTAPISNPNRVMDMGTGTGLWALDFSDQFPGADVLGVDLSPIQPTWVAPNCRFLVDDLEADWIYPSSQRFDYIHQRSLAGSIGDWKRLYCQALAHLSSGGWLEIQEFDVWFYSQGSGGLAEDSAIMRWQKLIDEASVGMGKRLNCAAELKAPLEAAGFTDVTSQIVKAPIGGWPKDRKLRDIGLYLQLQMNQALEAVTLGYFTRVLKWSEAETHVLIALVRNEFNDKSKQLYTYCRFISGRKPG
ncbi:S-adenosyl-L-methionine-dependent methyltransferase [Glonium stellatum]|uniref:S-adenosyl-L-methionine-dependent methyltransferase n=1 Tax=Glonium stellatum TaxID=574774 RepID=A0A8E2JR32_9PEZI|nr:S-adenosyl-L-methionine-dependent methyltransferase [Glonium stellatum]